MLTPLPTLCPSDAAAGQVTRVIKNLPPPKKGRLSQIPTLVLKGSRVRTCSCFGSANHCAFKTRPPRAPVGFLWHLYLPATRRLQIRRPRGLRGCGFGALPIAERKGLLRRGLLKAGGAFQGLPPRRGSPVFRKSAGAKNCPRKAHLSEKGLGGCGKAAVSNALAGVPETEIYGRPSSGRNGSVLTLEAFHLPNAASSLCQ